jgi:hypothetical protein
MYPTLQFIHILLLVYWLGADLGVYLCARYVGRADLPLAERRRFLELLVQLDMGPRTALVLMIPTGLALALLGGWLPLDPASVAAIGVAALAWLGLVWHLHRSGSMSGALWRIDHYLRHAVVALTLGWGAALLARGAAELGAGFRGASRPGDRGAGQRANRCGAGRIAPLRSGPVGLRAAGRVHGRDQTVLNGSS